MNKGIRIMSVIGRNVKTVKGFALAGLILGLVGSAPAADPYLVEPVEKDRKSVV